MAKRGLIITYYFPPSGGGGVQRWTKFVKYLTRLDWNLTVITATSEKNPTSDPTLLDEIPPQTKIIRPDTENNLNVIKDFILRGMAKGYWQRWISSFINVTDSRKSWNKKVIPVIDKELANGAYDALIFSLPPYSLAELAAFYTGKLDIPVILDMRDPWTKNPYKIYPTAFHRKLDEFHETRVISKINNLICAYQSIALDFEKSVKMFSEKAVAIIPNGFDEDDFQNLIAVKPIEKNRFHLAFSGSFYSHLNRPDQVFKAISLLKNLNVNVQFHHIGESVYDLQVLAEKYGISDRLTTWGYRSHRECLEILSGMNALCFFLDPKTRNADRTIGGKVYEYLRLKKPVLAVVPEQGEAARLIRETHSGLICPRNYAREIRDVLLKIIQTPDQFTFNGISEYRRDHQARLLDSFIRTKLK